ncbi:MAG: indolepyruvate ferredoxin oxidoreductase subunit alpha [Clostridiales bacterium]|nr:MAG: indolepyruvate ferredoxin oxidoreductase subunit alpha [Clostridiales bacterium]
MKKLMLGNQAVARGLYEASCAFVSSYPGTPSTEITEYAAKYPEIYAEWAPNEKVAMEAAIGASISGVRSFCAMKHVGLNVAADPLFITSYIGAEAGMVIAVADDPGMHSSQNEQDSRHYAVAAKLPMLEPSDSAECRDFTVKAFELSEKFDTPFILRTSTRVAHSQSIVEEGERKQLEIKPYEKNPAKHVMAPANAIKRHVVVEQRLDEIAEWANICEFNRAEYNSEKLGIICAGSTYVYSKEVFGNDASYLKLGLVNPLPDKLIREFCSKVERVIVIEELDPVIETYVKSLGIVCDGKNMLPELSEFSQEVIAKCVLGKQPESVSISDEIPVRPPVLCPGCPHRGLFYTLKKMKLTVSGDIGCYTLGAAAPLSAVDTTLCMGASISGLHGMNKSGGISPEKSVAVIGDSTFAHSGVTGLMNIVYNKGISTVIIADNRITGMTGHQENPTTGKTLKEEITHALNLEKLCEAMGINDVKVIDPNDTKAMEEGIKDSLSRQEPSVIISRRPCVLLKEVKKDKYFVIDSDKCRSCKACMQIGCPAISMVDGKAKIDTTLCTGCGLCQNMCKFGCIIEKNR